MGSFLSSKKVDDSSTIVVVLGEVGDAAAFESDLADTIRLVEVAKPGTQLVFESEENCSDDSVTIGALFRIVEQARQKELRLDLGGLPQSVSKLITLAMEVPRKEARTAAEGGLIVNIGQTVASNVWKGRLYLEFFGEFLVCCLRFVRGKARFRKQDFWQAVQESGADALPIVSLISILVGMILAFVGGMQLQRFGASIFVADLVGLAMVREMGCMMTGVIMSGRTGAAFAAQLGSMKVNEEIDAFETLGVSPMEFLVLPRVFALLLMMPLLTLYSDLLGCVGGVFVSLVMDISPQQFYHQLHNSLTLTHISVGFGKSFVFGIIVAASGCFYGLNSGRSSASVGQAATSSVVAGITWIIIFDAIAAVFLQIFGI